MSTTNLRGKRRQVVVSTDAEFSSVRAGGGENFSNRESHYKMLVRKRTRELIVIQIIGRGRFEIKGVVWIDVFETEVFAFADTEWLG